MTTDKLLASCGCGAEAELLGSLPGHRAFVRCTKCGMKTAEYDTAGEACAVWNVGMSLAQEIEMLRKRLAAASMVARARVISDPARPAVLRDLLHVLGDA